MKIRLIGSICLAALLPFAQDKGHDKPQDKVQDSTQDSGLKRYMETCKPGPAHQRLAFFIGKWEVTTRMWMGPGKPQETKGKAESSWLYEGKVLKTEEEGSMMGIPMKKFMLLGYDNFKKAYVASLNNSLDTMLLHASGSASQDGKEIYLYGTMDEPMTGEIGKHVKYVFRIKGADEYVLEVHDFGIGETKTKVFELDYRRAK